MTARRRPSRPACTHPLAAWALLSALLALVSAPLWHAHADVHTAMAVAPGAHGCDGHDHEHEDEPDSPSPRSGPHGPCAVCLLTVQPTGDGGVLSPSLLALPDHPCDEVLTVQPGVVGSQIRPLPPARGPPGA